MKKLIFMLLFGMFTITSHAQEQLSFETPVLHIDNTTFTLIDVDDWGAATILVEIYDENGLLHQTGKLVNGQFSGTWQLFDSTGSLLGELKYHKGNRMWHKVYKDDGYTHITYKDNRPYHIETYSSRLAYN